MRVTAFLSMFAYFCAFPNIYIYVCLYKDALLIFSWFCVFCAFVHFCAFSYLRMLFCSCLRMFYMFAHFRMHLGRLKEGLRKPSRNLPFSDPDAFSYAFKPQTQTLNANAPHSRAPIRSRMHLNPKPYLSRLCFTEAFQTPH